MAENDEKARQVVKSIKLLESVFKTTPDPLQRARVKKDIEKLREVLQQMYPKANLSELEDAIYSDTRTTRPQQKNDFSAFTFLQDVEMISVSEHVDDEEVNIAGSILKHFEEKVWGVLSEQRTKLDFTHSSERDTLYRRLDQCSRSFKLFCQTIEDIQKIKSSEYIGQLNQMKIKQGRVFLFDVNDFFKGIRDFLAGIIADSEFGGTMVLNRDEEIEYASYEQYKTFDKWKVLDALKFMKNFVEEALKVIKVPNLKK